MTDYPPSSLFWSWGAFVFLSVNFFTGVLIARNSGIGSAIIGALSGFALLSLAVFPVVNISTRNDRNYSESIKIYIKNPIMKTVLILLVPVINTGWYSIQLTIVLSLLISVFPRLGAYVYIVSIFLAFLFASGAFRFGYKWLRYSGSASMIVLVVLFIFNVFVHQWDTGKLMKSPFEGNIFGVIQLVFGTWVFSSVTCLMDIARHVRSPKPAFIYVISALFVADILLIMLGYISASILDIGSMDEFLETSGGFLAALAVILNIWSTNDSNFYSTMKALETLKIDKFNVFLIVCLISGVVAGYGQGELFNMIGRWLILMSWIGVPLAIYWWIQFLRLGYLKTS